MQVNHTIVYVMRHIDIGGYIEIPYKKIGITGAGDATISSRLQQISNTKSPIKAQCIAAWIHDDARRVETAIHQLLEDSRVEGEWFYDRDDNLQERMAPLMTLIGAKPLEISDENDSYTKVIMKKEEKSRKDTHRNLLGEIAEILDVPLQASVRQNGPTFFSKEKKLTYYVNARKSGMHMLGIGRSKSIFEPLFAFLELHGYDVDEDTKGNVKVESLSSERVGEVINLLEREYPG